MMKNFKKREYNSLEGSLLKNHNVPKKHKANVLAHDAPMKSTEKQIPINWHEVKIILDATVVEKYLNNRKANSTISPCHREKIVVQKIPRLNQHVFSEKNNVMVKLEIPDDIGVNNNFPAKDSWVFDDVPVKQEDGIVLLDSVDKNAFYNGEFTELLNEDFLCKYKNNVTAVAALKNEVDESECCYEETIIDQESKDTLKNEEIFVGEEFKHEELVPSYENVESIDQENSEEKMKKKTRSARKRKRCGDCDDCNHELKEKSRVPSHSKVVTPKLSAKDPKKCKSQTSSKTNKSKSFPRVEEQKPNQESSTKSKSQKGYYRVYRCPHCDYKGRRKIFIQHCRNEHPSKFYSVEVPTKKKTMKHAKTMHVDEGGKSLDKICAKKMSDLTPFGQGYTEIRKYFLEMESEHIKLYCPKCAVTNNKIISKTPSRCEICRSQLLYQCQKCKETQNYYSHIWEHLMNQNSGCSISDSFIGDDEQALYSMKNRIFFPTVSSNEIENSNSEELCGITIRFPCRFCPLTCYDSKILFDHIAFEHLDEVDKKDIGDFVKEAWNFRRMVKEVNDKRFNDKLRNGPSEPERDDYHHGIESMLKPICLECKADDPHNREYCGKCWVNLYFVCLMCDELFAKYSVAWNHATRTCENRSFTLTFGGTYSAKPDESTTNEQLYYCNDCSFKNSSKLILYNHIESSHVESPDIQNLLASPKNLIFFYTCQFCRKSSSEFHIIEKHIAWTHRNQYRCEDTLEKILNRVIKNKRQYQTKPIYRYDDCGRRIRRTFSENVKLTKFYCPNCDETVHKNFRYVTDTSRCPKCDCKLRVHCKICNKGYFHWYPITAHFQNTKCGSVDIGSYDVDHSYCLRLPLPEVTMNSVAEDVW